MMMMMKRMVDEKRRSERKEIKRKTRRLTEDERIWPKEERSVMDCSGASGRAEQPQLSGFVCVPSAAIQPISVDRPWDGLH